MLVSSKIELIYSFFRKNQIMALKFLRIHFNINYFVLFKGAHEVWIKLIRSKAFDKFTFGWLLLSELK